MSADPQDRVTRLPISTLPEFLQSNPIEEDIATLQVRGQRDAADHEAPAASERHAEAAGAANVDPSVRTAEVMKALFPNGLQLTSDIDFAAFQLFSRVVADVAQFAQSGMQATAQLRKLAADAALLESTVASKLKR